MDSNQLQLKDKYIGMILDERYEILERIGSGGMALVYKARCHKLDRFVAVKILKDELAIDVEFRDRFQNESKAVAMLSHTNIVNVYDVSRSTNPDYIVMEYIEGLTLKEYMQSRGGVLTWKEALHFTAQITKALIHAHNKGIIHRDIKPQNIMLLHDSSVKVTDFGIARLATKSNTLTKDTLGSVHYISPEQAKGSTVDKRTDIYSLGVVLYEMLTGRLPFEGENSVAIALQHFTSTPLSPRELNPDIPRGLEAIVLRMMAPDLTRRYPAADALFEDLETFRRHPETEFDYEDLAASVVNTVVDMSIPRNSGKRSAGKASKNPEKAAERRRYNESVRRARRNVIMTCVMLVLITVAAGFIFLWNFILKDIFLPNELKLIVPDWRNSSYESIVNNTQYVGFFTFNKTMERSDTVREGYVISQSVLPGEQKYIPSDNLTEDGKALPVEPINVRLTVSSGAETLEMPDLTKTTDYRDARIRLQNMGLVVEDDVFELSETVTNGYVIRTEPAAGTTMRPGDSVTLYVSQGPEEKFQLVPGLKGRTVEDAKIIIEGYSLTVGDISAIESDQPYGTVLSQSPSENTEVKEHTKIDLMISDGSLYVDPNATPEPAETPDTTNPPAEQTDPPYTPEPANTEPPDGGDGDGSESSGLTVDD